jgi:hypothetical protein
VKPGDVLNGPVPFVVCAIVNDLDRFVTIPKFIVDGVVGASGLVPKWPVGVFVIFTEEGATICVYGSDTNQELEFKRNTVTLSEDENQNPPVGEAVWKLWKELRYTQEPTLRANLDKLMSQTTA